MKLSDFRGKKNVVVAFHPLAFTPVCATQMAGYQVGTAGVRRRGHGRARPEHRRAAGEERVGEDARDDHFDLLSDFYPHGEVAREVRRLPRREGISERAIFLVDKQGRVAWMKTYEIPEQPPNE